MGGLLQKTRSLDPSKCCAICRATPTAWPSPIVADSADENGVTFKYKDYRLDGSARYKTMTLPTDEFIRRFLIHVLPKGFHRIRHYGLLAKANHAANIARARELLGAPSPAKEPDSQPPEANATDQPRALPRPCPAAAAA